VRIETKIGSDWLERAVDDEGLEAAIDRERRDLAVVRRKLDESPNELDRTRLGRVLQRLGYHLLLRGEYRAAAARLEEASEIWKEFGRSRAAFLARSRRAEVELCRGELEEAERRADRLVDEAAEVPYRIYRDFVLELRGRIRAKRGDLDRSRRDLKACLEIRRERSRDRLAERVARLLEQLPGTTN